MYFVTWEGYVVSAWQESFLRDTGSHFCIMPPQKEKNWSQFRTMRKTFRSGVNFIYLFIFTVRASGALHRAFICHSVTRDRPLTAIRLIYWCPLGHFSSSLSRILILDTKPTPHHLHVLCWKKWTLVDEGVSVCVRACMYVCMYVPRKRLLGNDWSRYRR